MADTRSSPPRLWAGAFAALLCAIFAGSGYADERADCERLAAPLLQFEQLETETVDAAQTERALLACAEALSQDPSDPRLSLLYGLILIEHGEIEQGFVYLEHAAHAGDTSAEFFVGGLHRTQAMPWSTPELARHWLERAGHKGHAGAQVVLGEMHHQGIGMEQQPEVATFWLEQAADQGHAGAKFALGATGAGDPTFEDYDERSFGLLLEAAISGHPNAQYLAGYFYIIGYPMEPDVATGLALLEAAAAQDNELALVELGKIYLAGEHVARDEAKGRAWFCRAGAFGAGVYASHYGEPLVCD